LGQNAPRCDNNLSRFAARLEKRKKYKKNYVQNSILLKRTVEIRNLDNSIGLAIRLLLMMKVRELEGGIAAYKALLWEQGQPFRKFSRQH
jgi:hypothetical protein